MATKRLRFHLDEHVPHAVANALRRLGIDVTTTPEVGLRQADDLAHLAFSKRERRVIVTQDADFLRHHTQGISHAGIAYCQKGSRTIGQMVETLRLMWENNLRGDQINRWKVSAISGNISCDQIDAQDSCMSANEEIGQRR